MSRQNVIDANKKRTIDINSFDWVEIQKCHDEGMTDRQICEKFKFGYHRLQTAKKLGFFIFNPDRKIITKPKRTHSEETKAKMSKIRKKFLKENPDKHHWRNSDKFKSEPCENVKQFLTDRNIKFIPEFQPVLEDRNFSIDIAIPDKLIAIEINGNQHYERSGVLKPYYKEREELLEKYGWTVYQVHYSACFKIDKWEEFFSKIVSSESKVEFDYFNYVPRQPTIYLCVCGTPKCYGANLCMECCQKAKRKAIRPSKEELEKLIWEKPLTKIGEDFGMSDNAIRKWCKDVGIVNFPTRSYRRKQFTLKKS